jgi:TetR/AcrR family transcriptional regulator, cholesterol catabolism regulator
MPMAVRGERGAAGHPTGAAGRRFAARRDRILDIAVQGFRHRGYAGTSIQDISRALGRSKGSLYYYFRDKEDILFGCHARSLDHLLAAAEAVRAEALDPAATLARLIENHVTIMVQAFRGTALALEVGALTGTRRARVVHDRDRYETLLREVIEEGVRRGQFRPLDAKLTAFAILGAVNWMARWYRAGGGRDAATVGRAFADLFVHALRVTPGARRPARHCTTRRVARRS